MSEHNTDDRHFRTDEVMCPHCHKGQLDFWEFNNGEERDIGVIECGWCEKKFRARRMIDVSYTSWIEEKTK